MRKAFYRWLNSEGNPSSLWLAMALGVASFGILLSFLAFQSPVFEPSPRKPMVAEIELFSVPSDQTAGAEPSTQTAVLEQPAQSSPTPPSGPIRSQPAQSVLTQVDSVASSGQVKTTPETTAKAVAKSSQPGPLTKKTKALAGDMKPPAKAIKPVDRINQPKKPASLKPTPTPVVVKAKPLVNKQEVLSKPVPQPTALQNKPAIRGVLEVKIQKPPAVSAKAVLAKPAAKSSPKLEVRLNKPQVDQSSQKPGQSLSNSPKVKPVVASSVVAEPKVIAEPKALVEPKVAISVRTDATQTASASTDITFALPSNQQAGSPDIVRVEPLIEAAKPNFAELVVQPVAIQARPEQLCTRVRQVGQEGESQATIIESVALGSHDCMFP